MLVCVRRLKLLLHDRTGRLESFVILLKLFALLHDRTGRLEMMT